MELVDRWRRLWAEASCRGDAEAAFADLIARYSEPHRAYHALGHLEQCFAALDTVEAVSTTYRSEIEVAFALWFHDAIYDTHAGDNEEQSARLAERALAAAGLAPATVARVAACVRVTAHAAEPAAPDEALMLDVDLCILGQPARAFDAYEQQVRREYEWVPDVQFRSTRAQILRRFLDRPYIYNTDHFRRLYEAPARENLARSIAALGA
jgi:predicted metal-dependent HD superfamily phosphohydrolase